MFVCLLCCLLFVVGVFDVVVLRALFVVGLMLGGRCLVCDSCVSVVWLLLCVAVCFIAWFDCCCCLFVVYGSFSLVACSYVVLLFEEVCFLLLCQRVSCVCFSSYYFPFFCSVFCLCV